MKTFEVVLIKSYIVKIKAKDENKAKVLAEIFTDDIQDISTIDSRKKFAFEIESIDCKVNQAFEIR